MFNVASGEMIPDDEPVMVFRARDIHAVRVIEHYLSRVRDEAHFDAVAVRRDDFLAFAAEHPERMKEPDTALQSPTVGSGVESV